MEKTITLLEIISDRGLIMVSQEGKMLLASDFKCYDKNSKQLIKPENILVWENKNTNEVAYLSDYKYLDSAVQDALENDNTLNIDKIYEAGEKRELFAMRTDFPGETIFTNAVFTSIREVINEALDGINNVGVNYNDLANDLEDKFLDFVENKIKEDKIIENLKENEILPVILNSSFDKTIFVSKNKLDSETYQLAADICKDQRYSDGLLTKDFKYIKIHDTLYLGDKYMFEFTKENKQLIEKAKKQEEISDWYTFFNWYEYNIEKNQNVKTPDYSR